MVLPHSCKTCLGDIIDILMTNKKIIAIATPFLIAFALLLPIYQTIGTETFEIQIPHKVYTPNSYSNPEYKIQVVSVCPVSPSFRQPEFQGISPMKDIKFNNYPPTNRVINFTYGSYDIAIFGIEKCDCINDSELGFNQPKSCTLTDARVYGYFRNLYNKTDTFIPFVLDTHLQLLSPDKTFRLSFTIDETREQIRSGDYLIPNTDYVVNATIFYPKMGAHPIVIRVAKLFIQFSDPVRAVFDANRDEWTYK